MIVSFDFDGVLSRYQSVRDYAKELASKGLSVWICTARYEDGKKNAFWGNTSNDDLFTIALECGIPFSNIIFTNMEDKSSYLQELQPIWHLDDDDYIIKEINDNSSIPCIDVGYVDWKQSCERIITLSRDI